MTVSIDPSKNTNSFIEIYTVNGELITTVIPDFRQNNRFQLDIKHTTGSGMYFLKIISEENTVVKKIMVH